MIRGGWLKSGGCSTETLVTSKLLDLHQMIKLRSSATSTSDPRQSCKPRMRTVARSRGSQLMTLWSSTRTIACKSGAKKMLVHSSTIQLSRYLCSCFYLLCPCSDLTLSWWSVSTTVLTTRDSRSSFRQTSSCIGKRLLNREGGHLSISLLSDLSRWFKVETLIKVNSCLKRDSLGTLSWSLIIRSFESNRCHQWTWSISECPLNRSLSLTIRMI